MGRKKKVEPIQFVFNPVFEPLFSDNIDDPRYYQVYGGRGSGKTFVAIAAAVRLTYSPHRHKILFLRQTMTSSEDSTISGVRNMIRAFAAEGDFKESKGVITNIRTGATINFKGIRSSGNQSAKLKSIDEYTTVIFEEAEEIESFEEFGKVNQSIRIKGKPLKIILVYNPGSAINSWIHKEWFINGRPREDRLNDTVYMHSTYLDNLDNLAQSTVDDFERSKETNPIYYRNTILAEWTLEVDDPVYAGWGEVDSFEDDGDIWYGLDFGYGGKDRTALVKINYYDDVYYVEELFSKPKMRIRDILSEMRNKEVPYNAKIYADSGVPMLITEIRKGGYKSIRKASKGKVEEGIKKVQDQNIVIVNPLESQLYNHYLTFAKKNGKLPHEPDSLAALRYAIISRRPIKNNGEKRQRPPRPKKVKRF